MSGKRQEYLLQGFVGQTKNWMVAGEQHFVAPIPSHSLIFLSIFLFLKDISQEQ